MPQQTHSVQQIIGKLREAEVLISPSNLKMTRAGGRPHKEPQTRLVRLRFPPR